MNDNKRKNRLSEGAVRIRHRLSENAFNPHILCPDSYRSRWAGMASHSLLQRRFAPRKVVRLLPVKRGRLVSSILFFMYSFSIRTS